MDAQEIEDKARAMAAEADGSTWDNEPNYYRIEWIRRAAAQAAN